MNHTLDKRREECGATQMAEGFSESSATPSIITRNSKYGFEIIRFIPGELKQNAENN